LSTDGSEVAQKGIEQGIALAKALNAKITIITVTEPLPATMGACMPRDGFLRRQKLIALTQPARNAGKILDEATAMAKRVGLPAERLHVPNAYPAAAIIETAQSKSCDLIVMASHGRRGVRKLLLGSQTSEVLVDGSVPVLVV
jgi:nucleotide-binding universal stress UspA family protein